MEADTLPPPVVETEAPVRGPLSAVPAGELRLDRMRDFGAISPPEMLTCAGGKSIATAFSEEPSRKASYEQFMDMAARAGHEIEYKTRAYEQDGFSFDAQGHHIPETLDVAGRARANAVAAKRAANVAAKRAYEQAMKDQGFKPGQYAGFEDLVPEAQVTASSVSENIDTTGVKNTVDLVAWATGKADVKWFAVAKAMREQYNFTPRNAENAREWMIENRKIPG